MANTKPSSTFLGISSGDTWTYATEQATTSGTTVNFTGIAAGTRVIWFVMDGVGNTGDATLDITLGDSGGIETSGYIGTTRANYDNTVSQTVNRTSAFNIVGSADHFDTNTLLTGYVNFVLTDESNEVWTMTGVFGSANGNTFQCSGRKSLSGELTQLRVTLSTGAFDAGTVGIITE